MTDKPGTAFGRFLLNVVPTDSVLAHTVKAVDDTAEAWIFEDGFSVPKDLESWAQLPVFEQLLSYASSYAAEALSDMDIRPITNPKAEEHFKLSVMHAAYGLAYEFFPLAIASAIDQTD